MKKILFWEPIIWKTELLSEMMTVTTQDLTPFLYSLIMGYIFYFIGILGIFIRQTSILYTMIAVELFLFGLNLVFLSLSVLLNEPQLQMQVLLILTLTAAETAIGLSLIVLYHNVLDTTSITLLKQLKY
jgi:NADH-quinone oxidoreductase subunit K